MAPVGGYGSSNILEGGGVDLDVSEKRMVLIDAM